MVLVCGILGFFILRLYQFEDWMVESISFYRFNADSLFSHVLPISVELQQTVANENVTSLYLFSVP